MDVYLLIFAIIGWGIAVTGILLTVHYKWKEYKMNRPILKPMLEDVEFGKPIHPKTTPVHGPHTENQKVDNGKYEIELCCNIGFENIREREADLIEAYLQWKDKYGNLFPREDLLRYILKDINYIDKKQKVVKKYRQIFTHPDINFWLSEASIEVKYSDSLGKQYYAIQLFSSPNGRIWYRGLYQEMKIGFLKKKFLLKLHGRESKKIENIFDWCAQYIRKIGIKIMENRKV